MACESWLSIIVCNSEGMGPHGVVNAFIEFGAKNLTSLFLVCSKFGCRRLEGLLSIVSLSRIGLNLMLQLSHVQSGTT